MIFQVIGRVVQGCGYDNVGRDELGTLVHELVEGMLVVRTQCVPDNDIGFGKKTLVRIRKVARPTRVLTPVW